MPFKNKKKNRDYMAEYMRKQRKQDQILRRQILQDKQRVAELKKQFPDAYKLLFGKRRRK